VDLLTFAFGGWMNTFLLHKIQQKLKYNKITLWFHTLVEGKEYEGTPAETIMEMNDLFIDLLKQKRLNLGVSEKVFRHSMCRALCTMKLYKDVNIYNNGQIQYLYYFYHFNKNRICNFSSFTFIFKIKT
jgi:hypothetical protein